MLTWRSLTVCSVGGIGTSIAVTRVAYIPDFPKFRSIAILWIAGAVIADVMITTTLVLYLVRTLKQLSNVVDLTNILYAAPTQDRYRVHRHPHQQAHAQ